MTFVSITRLRVRSWRFVIPFFIDAQLSLRQAKYAQGFLGGALLQDRKFTFWTATLWRDQDAMRQFMLNGPHKRSMPKLLNWADEASVVHWIQEDAKLPDWMEADRRMRAEGRPSKVRNPSAVHQQMKFTLPRAANVLAVKPASAK
jgi:hypothetical protein